MPFHYPGYMEVEHDENAAMWEAAWNVEPGGLSRKRGLTTTEILSHAHPGGVRSLYIMGENPMMTEPNLNVTRQHMEQLEFLVAQDIFINESGAYADVILPAAAWAEKEGTFTNTDRRVQRVRKAIAPRGQARADWEIICDLAQRIEQRLGRPNSAGWDYTQPEQIYREMASVATTCSPGITYERIEQVGLQYPVPDETHPGTPYLFAESFPPAAGVSSRWSMCPVAEEPDEEYPFILTTGRLLEHWHGGTMTRHSQLDALYPTPYVEVHEIDAAAVQRAHGRRRARLVAARVDRAARAGLAQSHARGRLHPDALCRGGGQRADDRRRSTPRPRFLNSRRVRSISRLPRRRRGAAAGAGRGARALLNSQADPESAHAI